MVGSLRFFIYIQISLTNLTPDQRRIQGEGWGGGNPPFGNFSNLSGYPCLSLFHTKTNILSYNMSSSPIEYHVQEDCNYFSSWLLNHPNTRSIFWPIATPAIGCLVPSIIVNKALQLDDEVGGMLFSEKDISFLKSLGNEVRRWKRLW